MCFQDNEVISYTNMNAIHFGKFDADSAKGASVAQALFYERGLSDEELLAKYQDSTFLAKPRCFT